MTAVLDKPKATPEDLLKLPRDHRYEPVDGQLVEKKTAWTSAVVKSRLFLALAQHVVPSNLREVLSDETYQCFRHALSRVRRPDLSFLRREAIAPDLCQPGHIRIAPDLVVEVLSPDGKVSEVGKRVLDYLGANVPLVWVVHPESRHVDVYRPGERGEILSEWDELTGEPVPPGFRLPVREIFRPLDTMPANTPGGI